MEEMTRVHPQDYVEAILGIQPGPGEHVHVDGDTVMGQGSAEAVRRAAGAVVAGVEAVMEGKVRTAFAAVRPPGHHAAPGVPGGFCLINNAAVGARHAQAKYGVERVAIVDFDVHHGQGTQAVVEPDPTLFYASTHQYPLYPGTGSPRETGTDNNVVNVPLRAGSGSAEFRAAWSERILPMLDDFAPELVIVSAGFDAHRADPLAQLEVETDDFVWLTEERHSAALVRWLRRYVAADARIIGVNNRDLRTLDVRLETSLELIDLIPDDRIAVAESGLSTNDDLLRLRGAGFDAFLIGEHLMRADDPAAALSDLLGAAPAAE